jgi:hypothetical protein
MDGESVAGDPAGLLRDKGAIDKGARDVIGRGGAVIGCFHICHF